MIRTTFNVLVPRYTYMYTMYTSDLLYSDKPI